LNTFHLLPVGRPGKKTPLLTSQRGGRKEKPFCLMGRKGEPSTGFFTRTEKIRKSGFKKKAGKRGDRRIPLEFGKDRGGGKKNHFPPSNQVRQIFIRKRTRGGRKGKSPPEDENNWLAEGRALAAEEEKCELCPSGRKVIGEPLFLFPPGKKESRNTPLETWKDLRRPHPPRRKWVFSGKILPCTTPRLSWKKKRERPSQPFAD